MAKRKGVKIYRTKHRYSRQKSKLSSVFAVIITVIIVVVLGVIGYSVADPIYKFFTSGPNNSSISEYIPSMSESESISEELPDSTSFSEDEKSPTNEGSFYLNVDVLSDETTLKNAIESIPASTYTSVVVPLKTTGGALHYDSAIEGAISSQAVQSTLGLQIISKIITDAGFKPVASISMFEDSIYSKYYKDAGYVFASDGSAWYDDKPSNGGKPWLSPFSTQADEYLNQVVQECSDSGFGLIMCKDLIFPYFRNIDVSYLGDKVVANDRYRYLTKSVKNKKTAVGDKSKIAIEVSAEYILKGSCEVLKPDELSGISVVPVINLKNIGETLVVNGAEVSFAGLSDSEKTQKILELIKPFCGELEIIPCIDSVGITSGNLSDSVNSVIDLDYKNYIVK